MFHRPRLLAATASLCLFAGAGIPAVASADPVDLPTADAVRVDGPYTTAKVSVPESASSAFGTATITYPTDASGKVGAIAVSPGYTAKESTIAWYGQALASHGFAVITFNTNSVYDQPAARATALLAAVDYLTGSSAVAAKVDASRTAVMGHSMGGGGAIEAAKRRSTLKAAVGLTPWNLNYIGTADRSPTLIIGAEKDTIAAPYFFANPLYAGINSSTPKMLSNLAGLGHMAPISRNTAIEGTVVAWMKRFVDGDTRYTSLLCPANTAAPSGSLSRYQANCSSW
ncbi:MAG: hypothetical protein QM679_05890 [Patulibacter sp.]